jgi:hypothetical protein
LRVWSMNPNKKSQPDLSRRLWCNFFSKREIG